MDLPSVIVVSALVTSAVGFLLVYSGLKSRVEAVLWWGVADLLLALGTAAPTINTTLAEGSFIEIANAAVLIGWGIFWAGIRKFEGRPANFAWAALGGVVWLVASQIPFFQADAPLRLALSLLISSSYVISSALLVIRGRDEPLTSRNAAIFLLCAHAVILVGRIPEAVLSDWIGNNGISRSQLFAAFAMENLLFTVAMAFVLLAMMKERMEAVQKDAAYTDPLTRSPNRRAFFERGLGSLADCKQAGQLAALVLFDLDHFKMVNDTHGHAAGDKTIITFAQAAVSELRPKDLFARIGGEEFACLLPGLSMQEAVGTADRIRMSMSSREIAASEGTFRATVSAGVQLSDPGHLSLDDMMRGADRALYEAKTRGRNRVEVNKPDLVFRAGERVHKPEDRRGSVARSFRNRA